MKKIIIHHTDGPELIRLEVPDENPYDEGYLLSPSDVEEILIAWRDWPKEDDIIRGYEFQEDNEWLATALVMDGELTISLWESTENEHEWDPDNWNGGVTAAYSTSMWPFDFTIEEVTEEERPKKFGELRSYPGMNGFPATIKEDQS